MAISKEDIKKKVNTTPVVTQSVKQSMEQPQSQELQSVLKRTVQQQPVVTNNIRQQVEGTTPSTPQSQELQSIQDRTEQQMAKQKVMQKPVVTEQIKQAVESTTPSATAPTAESDPYAFFDNYIKSKQPTPEELEAERKRERRKAIFNAIGDGVSSLANLYFTTKGAPNSYNPADNMTRKQLERYERLKAERKADEDKWLNAQMRLAQLRDSANWRKQQTEYQKQRDNVADARYKEQQEQQAAKLAAEAERWERKFKHEQDEAEKNRGIRQAEIDARKAHNAATLAETKRYHDQVAEARQSNKDSKDRYPFPDGNGGSFSIHKNVIANFKGEIFDAIKQDLAESSEYGIEAPMTDLMKDMTDAQVLQYIEMNGYKSPRAVKVMERLQYIEPNKIQQSTYQPKQESKRGVAKWVKKEDSKDSNKIEF